MRRVITVQGAGRCRLLQRGLPRKGHFMKRVPSAAPESVPLRTELSYETRVNRGSLSPTVGTRTEQKDFLAISSLGTELQDSFYRAAPVRLSTFLLFAQAN